jgi:hypothetical protein
MKKLVLLIILCTCGLLCETTSAQIRFRVNIDTQPIWGPVGYDHVDNYYLPDIQAYYNVPSRQYTYQVNGRWITRASLPSKYRNYDMYRTRKVVMNENRPYMHHGDNVSKYGSQNQHSNQQSIRDSHDSKYFVNKNHPEHSKMNNKDQERNKRHENK